MSADQSLVLEKAKLLYNVKLVREIIMGNSGNRIFEVERGETAYILRSSAYSIDRKEHTGFELKWMDYLSDTMTGIVRPQKSIKNNLYEVIEAEGKEYILCLFEKAPGKIVETDNPNEFNEKLFYNLGALMGEMHRLTRDYEDNVRKPAFEWTGAVNAWRCEHVILDERVRHLSLIHI